MKVVVKVQQTVDYSVVRSVVQKELLLVFLKVVYLVNVKVAMMAVEWVVQMAV